MSCWRCCARVRPATTHTCPRPIRAVLSVPVIAVASVHGPTISGTAFHQVWYTYVCIKSGGDFGRPATEPEKRPRCSPSKEGIRPVGAKTTLVLPNFRSHLLLTGGMMSSHNDSFVASGSSPTVDFICENHGSIFLLRPLSQSAQSWIEEHLPSDAQWFGNGVVVEHRFIWAILEGIQNDGLAVRA